MENLPFTVDEMVQIKILHRYDISPPGSSVPTTALPLTFLDIPWLLCCPMQRLFFYNFPQSLPPSLRPPSRSLSALSPSVSAASSPSPPASSSLWHHP
ncbi:hypothetical protein NL676_000780 [Syzygium grande]|nr:hypothetical protein NL676_000780 [Syzygium grande]